MRPLTAYLHRYNIMYNIEINYQLTSANSQYVGKLTKPKCYVEMATLHKESTQVSLQCRPYNCNVTYSKDSDTVSHYVLYIMALCVVLIITFH